MGSCCKNTNAILDCTKKIIFFQIVRIVPVYSALIRPTPSTIQKPHMLRIQRKAMRIIKELEGNPTKMN